MAETAAPRARPTRHVVHDMARRGPVRPRAPVRLEPTALAAPASAADRAVVAAVVEAMRPSFQADGGDVQLVDVAESAVRVRLSGVCADCGAAGLSLGGLQQRVSAALGRRMRVRPVTGPAAAGPTVTGPNGASS